MRAFIAALLLVTGACAAVAPRAARRPNVLFLISDDLAATALSCYGSTRRATPNIDRLAARGMRFTRAYCQYPVCGPSRAALMSGMYPRAIGVTGNGSAPDFTANLGTRPSLAQHFRALGYYTARIGKIYHMRVPGDITAGVDGPDHAASWSERFNCAGPEWRTLGRHALLSSERLDRDPERHYGLGFGTAFYSVSASEAAARQPDALAADKAIELMRAHRGEPFFLAVGFVRPHVPLVAPEEHHRLHPAGDMELPPRIADDWADIPAAGVSAYNSAARGLDDPEARRRVLGAYYACVAFMDAQVGRVLDALDDLGLRDDTVVVFTSDHGYHLGEHDFWQKMSLHEEAVRIPLVVAGPGVASAVCEGLVEQVDLFPTLAEVAGLGVPEHCQGVSLRPLLADPARRVRADAYALRSGAHLLRTRDRAYLEYPDGSVELYDMVSDPGQFTNLASSPAHARERARLALRLRERLAHDGG